MQVHKILLILLPTLLLAPSVFAATYIVDGASIEGTCDDAYLLEENDEAHPWCSIQRAADVADAGDAVLIRGGTYTGRNNKRILLANSGSPGNYITYKGYPNEEVWIDGEHDPVCKGPDPLPECGSDWREGIFHLYDRSYIIIEDLNIRNCGTYEPWYEYCGVMITSSSHHVIVRNITASYGRTRETDWTGGVCVSHNTHDILVENSGFWHNLNELRSTNAAGVTEVFTDNFTIRGNEIYEQISGVLLKSYEGSSTTIEKNVIYNSNIGVNSHLCDPWNPENKCFDYDTGALIQENIVYDTYTGLPEGEDYCWIGIWLAVAYGYYTGSYTMQYHTIKNNAVYGCSHGYRVGNHNGLTTASDTIWRNNIALDDYGGDEKRELAIRIYAADSNDPINFDSDYNDFYDITTTQVINWLGNIWTLYQYQNNKNHDLHSITIDPKFTDPVQDFHLLPNSPARGAGEDGLDMGAYPMR